MLSEVFLEKFYSNPEICKIPIGMQPIVVKGLEEVLEELQKEKRFVSISQLFAGGGKVGGGKAWMI